MDLGKEDRWERKSYLEDGGGDCVAEVGAEDHDDAHEVQGSQLQEGRHARVQRGACQRPARMCQRLIACHYKFLE